MSNNEEFSKMLEEWKKDSNYLTKVAREIVFNTNQTTQNRYVGLMILLDDARNRKAKIEHGIRRMEGFLNILCENSLKEYKKQRIIQFTEKWAGQEVNELMATEMQALEKPNHCYTFSGIKVIELDCNLCKSRKCQSSSDNYVPNQFENLLGGYTEPIPEGCQSVEMAKGEPESEVDNGAE